MTGLRYLLCPVVAATVTGFGRLPAAYVFESGVA